MAMSLNPLTGKFDSDTKAFALPGSNLLAVVTDVSDEVCFTTISPITGFITGITCLLSGDFTSGTMTFRPHVAGTPPGGGALDLAFTGGAGDLDKNVAISPTAAYAVTTGQQIGVAITRATVVAPGGFEAQYSLIVSN